jgi:hypothetical protein
VSRPAMECETPDSLAMVPSHVTMTMLETPACAWTQTGPITSGGGALSWKPSLSLR